MLKQKVEVDRIESFFVSDYYELDVWYKNITFDDESTTGLNLNEEYYVEHINPCDDLDGKDDKIKDAASKIFTEEVKSNYRKHLVALH